VAALLPESGTVILITPTVRRQNGLLHWLGQVLAWTVMLGVGAILLVALIIPRVAGATPYVIETSSMRPTLPPGTMVIVKPAAPSAIAAGNVITYQIKSGDPTVVTHRVKAVGYDGLGQVRFKTQGDANDAMDKNWVLPEQIRGKEWYAIPYLGHVAFWVDGSARSLVLGLVIVALIGYALRSFLQSAREKSDNSNHRESETTS
jgi:signal peptidase I